MLVSCMILTSKCMVRKNANRENSETTNKSKAQPNEENNEFFSEEEPHYSKHRSTSKEQSAHQSKGYSAAKEHQSTYSSKRYSTTSKGQSAVSRHHSTLTANRSNHPMSKTSQKDSVSNQGFYLTHLNMTSADVRRRLKEKEFVEEAIAGMKQKKEDQKIQSVLEKRENLEMLRSYDPWGKPGGGAPRGVDAKKEKFLQNLTKFERDEEIDNEKNILSFGKPGNGAPNRTKSGRRATKVKADPDLRFQNNKDVRKSVENTIRYKAEKQAQKTYHEDLDRMVEYKKIGARKASEQGSSAFPVQQNTPPKTPEWQSSIKSLKKNVYPDDPEGFNYNPWGQGYGYPERDARGNVRRHRFAKSKEHGVPEYMPKEPPEEKHVLVNKTQRGGAGAPIRTENGQIRTQLPVTLDGQIILKENLEQHKSDNSSPQSTVPGKEDPDVKYQPYAGRNFIEKLGWSTSGQPHRRNQNAKKEYLDSLQKAMNDKEEKTKEEKVYNKDGGVELVSLMKESVVGKPKKDPYTGELLNHHKLKNGDPYAQGPSMNGMNGDVKTVMNRYHEDLTRQTMDKISNKNAIMEQDRRKSLEHIESWAGIWGKPGNGAPLNQQNHHVNAPATKVPDPYAASYSQNVIYSTHKHRYEVDSDKHVAGQKDYKFKIPYASAEYQDS